MADVNCASLGIIVYMMITIVVIITAIYMPNYHQQIVFLPGGGAAEITISLFNMYMSSRCQEMWYNAPPKLSHFMARFRFGSQCKWLVNNFNGKTLEDAALKICRDEAFSVRTLFYQLCDLFQNINLAAQILVTALCLAILFEVSSMVLTFFWMFIRTTKAVRNGVLATQCFAILALTLGMLGDRVINVNITTSAFMTFIWGFNVTDVPASWTSMHYGYWMYAFAWLLAILQLPLCILFGIKENRCIDSEEYMLEKRSRQLHKEIQESRIEHGRAVVDEYSRIDETLGIMAAAQQTDQRLARIEKAIQDRHR